ncbi:hypothetical protein COZ22_00745 [bacterium (Candidatus Howlettbacteria) CG_4_10_14_3_um_filter_37_10]|nr:MAG: hypothetical protein COX25_05675 [bacterium (Candidatus Howlettbacteria) CG23_combo_of_CG06-09_8_20_14_all_37_9]PIY00227.1 MAG: hypothetical protein COZ22_00745 [bacterium (Candidatus Howlettbacteria) CG_4_10_14_3_um_filter_37_10]
MSSEYSYDEIFQRNIGIFTPEEQEKIMTIMVVLAGMGLNFLSKNIKLKYLKQKMAKTMRKRESSCSPSEDIC